VDRHANLLGNFCTTVCHNDKAFKQLLCALKTALHLPPRTPLSVRHSTSLCTSPLQTHSGPFSQTETSVASFSFAITPTFVGVTMPLPLSEPPTPRPSIALGPSQASNGSLISIPGGGKSLLATRNSIALIAKPTM
jgi:hypothetical protein